VLFLDNENHTTKPFSKIAKEPLSNTIAALKKLNRETNGLISGAYLPASFIPKSALFTKEEFEISKKLNIPVGFIWGFCSDDLVNEINATILFLKKFKFITCILPVKIKDLEPEAAAEGAMYIGRKFEKMARLANIKAEIFLSIRYHTESRWKFQRFWCHIADMIIRKKHNPSVIIDNRLSYYGSGGYKWWKLSKDSFGDQDTLTETFDYLPSDHVHEKCSNSCETCERLIDCCLGFCETIFYRNRELRVCVPINHTNECLLVLNSTGRFINETLGANETVPNTFWIEIITASLLVLLLGAILGVCIRRVSIVLQSGYILSFLASYFLQKKLSEKDLSNKEVERFVDGSDSFESNAIQNDKKLEVPDESYEVCKFV